jgi:RNA polymerase sigma-70 factor (ECF subfamily)
MQKKSENIQIRKADELFDEIRSGNQKALETLFAVYFPRLNDFARNVVKDNVVSQDIVQDVFVKIWEKRDEVETINLEAYLFRLVRNRCLDHIKHMRVVHNRMQEIEISSKFEELYRIDFIGDAPYLLIEKELISKIEETVKNLPDRCREVFILSRVNKLKNKEIADKLSISIKNVERHLSRAMQSLRENLNEEFSVALIAILLNGADMFASF